MNCKDFREKMPVEGDKSPEFSEHLKECADCRDWLKKQISEPPEGISAEQWGNITQKLSESTSQESKTAEPAEKAKDKPAAAQKPEDKTFWGYYFHGMTYGFVFGAALIVALAITDIYQEAARQEKEKAKIKTFSLTAFYESYIQPPVKKDFTWYIKRGTCPKLKFIDSDKSFRYILLKL